MSDFPRPENKSPVQLTYTLENVDWQNAFGEADGRPAHLLRQDALSELDKPQSPAYLAMKKNFRQIDLDGDGFLSPDEIKFAAKTDPALADLDADRQKQFEIKRLVNDGKNDARGISMRDVEAFGAKELTSFHNENDPKELKLAAEWLSKYFDKVNRHKDGFISKNDLDQLIEDPSLKFSFRQKFLLMERYFEPISELQKDKVFKFKEHEGLSQGDLKTLIANDGKFIFYRR